MFKYLLQLSIASITLLGSTFIAWYEGSAIVEDSLEWKYSTPFTEMFNIEIITGRDISQLDYFVYAVKFQPLFPTMMIVSILYMLCVIGHYLIKNQSRWAYGFWGFIGFIMLLISSFTFNSSTTGGNIFFWITSVSGLIFIVIGVLLRSQNSKHKLHSITQ